MSSHVFTSTVKLHNRSIITSITYTHLPSASPPHRLQPLTSTHLFPSSIIFVLSRMFHKQAHPVTSREQLFSLCLIHWKFIPAAVQCILIVGSFPWLSNIPQCGYTTVCLTSQLTDGLPGHFHSLTITNKAAKNIGVWVLYKCKFPFLWDQGPRVLDHMVTARFLLSETARLLLGVATLFTFPAMYE